MKDAGLPNEKGQGKADLMAMSSALGEATAYVAAEMDQKELQKAGTHVDEFFTRCTYNGLKCSLDDMKSFTDKRYGNCFTFNWNGSYYLQRHGANMGNDSTFGC